MTDPQPNAFDRAKGELALSAEDAPFAAERMCTLSRGLRRLLDESLRGLGAALAVLDAPVAASRGGAIDTVIREVQEAQGKLDRVCELVDSAMRGSASGIGSPVVAKGAPVSVVEAVEHAARVEAGLAREHRALVSLDLAPELHEAAAGGVYTPVVHAVREAILSVGRRGVGGGVLVVARSSQADGRSWVRITISDDGDGGAPGAPAPGLALASDIARELGGYVEIGARAHTGRALGRVGGRVVTIAVPDAGRVRAPSREGIGP